MQPPTENAAAARRIPESTAAIALAVAAFLAYLPCLNGAPVWDDEFHITAVLLRGFDGLLRIWIEPGAVQQYYPLLHSAFWLEYRLWGNSAFGYHAINVLFHAGSAYLLTRILRLLQVRGAWLAGFIFALHPVCTEAVAWISEQKSTLSGLFYFGAALAYLRFDESRKRSQYGIALLLFIAALLSKTVTATLPAALLVVLWWRRGSIRWKQDALPLVPWMAIGAAAGLGTAWVERTFIGATGSDFALSFGQRLLLAGRDLWFYAAKVSWPVNLTFIYPHWTIDARVWWQYAFTAGFLALLAILGVWARQNRAPLAAALFFAGTLFPVLGFLNVYPFRYSYVADHFQYLACVGIIVPAAWLISGLSARALGPAVVALLGLLTWRQTHEYTGPVALYRTTLARNPACWMAHTNVAILLAGSPSGRDEAIEHAFAAIRLKPNYQEGYNNLGSILSGIPGRQAEALDDFRTAIRIKPDYGEAHYNLGNEYYRQGRLPEAVAEYRAAAHAKPDLGEAHMNLGAILAQDPVHVQEGLDELHEAARLGPRFMPARMNLAMALGALPGHAMEAQLEYEDILRIEPRMFAARMNLGNLLMKSSDTVNDAVDHFRVAVALQPASPEAHLALSIGLFRVPGKQDEAMRELRAVLRLQPDNPRAKQMIDVLNARTGK